MRPLPSTMLFCPAHRPERYAKAWASGARAVVLDLEDGVPAAAREQARVQALEWLATSAVHTSPVWPALRINALRTSDGWADLVQLPNTWLRVTEHVIVAGPNDDAVAATTQPAPPPGGTRSGGDLLAAGAA